MDETRTMLNEEIKTEIEDLAAFDTGSKEKSTAIEDLTKLYKLRIEEVRTESEFDEKYARRVLDKEEHEQEVLFKKEEIANQTKDRYLKLGLEAAGIVLPMVFYAVWMKRGFKFEENGTFTSTTFRGLFNRFKPTGK